MAFRLVQLILPTEKKTTAMDIIEHAEVKEYWSVDMGEGRCMISVLLPSEGTEAIMEKLEEKFSDLQGYKALIFEVLAFAPHHDGREAGLEDGAEKKADKVSREELYATLVDLAKASRSYIALMFLSVVVAAIGILEENVAIVVGAAVINPLLGPNMSLSLATNIADGRLALTALRSVILGIGIVVLVSLAIGLTMDIEQYVPALLSSREAGLGEIILAVASGSAAAVLLTMKASTALVGVGAAVALLPPLVTFGILAGSGRLELSVSPLFLFLTDLISINLAGVFTFFIMGIRPFRWWEEDKGRRSTIIAAIIWGLLLASLYFTLQLASSP